MMDVSGSMSDEQKEIVRIEAFWIDTWLRRQYKGIETRYIIHDAAAREVDRDTFYHTRESRRHAGSAPPTSCAPEIIDERLPRLPTGTSTPSTSPTATTGAPTTPASASTCCASETCCPAVNLFCYGQVESPYGSGQFIKDLHEALRRATRTLVLSEIDGQGRHLRLDQDVPGDGQVSRHGH